MESLFRFIASPSQCGYLPDRLWSLEYDMVARITPAEYADRLRAGWRRFGSMLFRPRCEGCRECRSLRVVVDRFRPDRSQRRAARANAGQVQLCIGKPCVTAAKLDLYDRYHAHQADAKDWPQHPTKDPHSYAQSFVENPFRTEEWCYYLDGRLIGVGYVDDLPAGLSAIYFYYDPDERQRSLGTWNVLNVIEQAAARGLPHVYLGYYVARCPSMLYKARFIPNQLLGEDGAWHDFRT
ncbi:MAG TPA: arginyltransferase [Gemmataceae bacterium]|nr:arginyltransferase [Gemmataceae bacterium]